MRFIETKIKDLYIIEPEPYYDNRGYFGRIFCKNETKEIGFNKQIVQINQSLTKEKGTIRGMHFQYPPYAEIKIIKCLNGKVFDVAIDLRNGSPSFLKWHGEILSSDNMRTMYIPKGFAHGFQSLVDNCELLYLHSEYYHKEYESGVRYDDSMFSIDWPLDVTNISQRDAQFLKINADFKGLSL